MFIKAQNGNLYNVEHTSALMVFQNKVTCTQTDTESVLTIGVYNDSEEAAQVLNGIQNWLEHRDINQFLGSDKGRYVSNIYIVPIK